MEYKISFKDVPISTWIIPLSAFRTVSDQLQNGVRFTIDDGHYMNYQYGRSLSLKGRYVKVGHDYHFLLDNHERRDFIARLCVQDPKT